MVNTFSWPPALWGSASPRRRCRRWASAPPGRTLSPASAKQPDRHKASLSQSSASYSWLKLTCSSGRSAITVATPLLLPCMALLAPLSRQAVDLGSMLAISLPFGKPWVFVNLYPVMHFLKIQICISTVAKAVVNSSQGGRLSLAGETGWSGD